MANSHKANAAAARNRARYVSENRREKNKRRKAAKERKKLEKLAKKGRGPLAIKRSKNVENT